MGRWVGGLLEGTGLGELAPAGLAVSSAAAVAREELGEDGLEGLVDAHLVGLAQVVPAGRACVHICFEGPLQTFLQGQNRKSGFKLRAKNTVKKTSAFNTQQQGDHQQMKLEQVYFGHSKNEQ